MNIQIKQKPQSSSAGNPGGFGALSDLLDAEGIPRVAIDEVGNILYASRSFYELAGLDHSEVRPHSHNAFELFQFETPTSLQGISTGTHAIIFRGSESPYLFHFDHLTGARGKDYIIASMIKREKKPLAQESDFFLKDQDDLRRFLNMSQDIMIIAEPDGTLVRVNRTFCEVLGYAPEDLRGMNFIDLFSPQDRSYVQDTVQRFMVYEDNDEAIDFEARVNTRDQRMLWMEWRRKERDGLLYLAGRDVTQTKLHDTALVKRKEQLSEAEAIGRMGHWRWTLGEDTLEWSDEIYRIFGVKKGEFKPTLDKLNQVVVRRDVGRVIQGFQRAMIEKNAYGMEFRIKCPDGEIKFIRCEGRCEKDASGDVIALFGIMQDMTERNLYEAELRGAKEEAERAYAAKTQFLANMSHELRTPLNAIIGFSEMMQRELLGPIGTPQYIDYIKGIRESGEHLLDLISDILDMSKIEAGKYELDLEEVSIAKVIKVATHMMEGRAMEAGVKLSVCEMPDEDFKIVADRRAVMQILLNLLSNAVKFTREGGAVWIDCAPREDGVTLKVSDTGIGIPPNKLQSITRPFEQASSSYSRDHEGTGLGLAITKELVEIHGGTLLINSIVDVGTNVTVKLPLKPQPRQPAEESQA